MPLALPASRADIDTLQRERKKVAVERALASPFHQGRIPKDINFDKLDNFDEWQRIPILDKETLRAIPPDQFMSRFCSAPNRDIAELWRSGGSTGAPLFYPRTFEDMKYGRLSFARVFQCAGASEEDLAHISFPLGIHPVGHLMARAAQHLNIGVNWAGAGNSTPSEAQINLINMLQPTIWMGMSSYGLHLANLAEAVGIDLPGNSVNRLICSAEQVTDAKRARIERMWGARLYDSFGMTEAGMMGCEGEARDGFHVWTDMYFIEVLHPDTLLPVAEGETGTLVVTPLWTNNATPFIRWNSGDLVTYRAQGDSDGPFSVFPLIKHTHRTAGFFKIRGVNMNHTEFEDFMFRQSDVADFKVELVTENDLETLQVFVETSSGAEPEAVRANLQDSLKSTFEVTASINVLDRGTLAREFETSVKAPRFIDKRV
jgi:phenylacetate-CoA ligase